MYSSLGHLSRDNVARTCVTLTNTEVPTVHVRVLGGSVADPCTFHAEARDSGSG